MAAHPRPLAVGLIQTPSKDRHLERTRSRISLALWTNEEGYSLLEIVETDGSTAKDDAAFQALEELAERYEVQAVACAGPVDRERVEELAERERLMVIFT
jgi:hypothetical protein